MAPEGGGGWGRLDFIFAAHYNIQPAPASKTAASETLTRPGETLPPPWASATCRPGARKGGSSLMRFFRRHAGKKREKFFPTFKACTCFKFRGQGVFGVHALAPRKHP